MKKLLLIGLLIVGCDKEEEGCTDSNAINFNPNATVDDNTCEYSVHDGFPDFESICGMDEFGNPTENIGDGICGLCLGQIEYEGSLGESGGIHVQPMQTELTSPYPNPFGGTTSINFGIDSETYTIIYIMNTDYNMIDTLIQYTLHGGGYYALTWNASKFPSGYYRIVADFGDVECFQNAYKPLDCAGVVGGDTVEDECGECGGDGADDSEVALWGECYSIEETTDLVRMGLFYYGYRTISPDIGSLTNLTTLNLSHNQLIELPEEICDIYSNLSEFDVSDNHICGDLPSCLTAEDIGWQYCP